MREEDEQGGYVYKGARTAVNSLPRWSYLVELGQAVAALHDAGTGLLEDVGHGHQLRSGCAERQCLSVDLLQIDTAHTAHTQHSKQLQVRLKIALDTHHWYTRHKKAEHTHDAPHKYNKAAVFQHWDCNTSIKNKHFRDECSRQAFFFFAWRMHTPGRDTTGRDTNLFVVDIFNICTTLSLKMRIIWTLIFKQNSTYSSGQSGAVGSTHFGIHTYIHLYIHTLILHTYRCTAVPV